MRSSSRTTRGPVSEVSATKPRHSRVKFIDHRQDAEAPPAHHRVHDEVERPAQVLILRDRHRRARAQSPLAAATLTHGQPLFLVKPIELLVVQPDALASQQQAQTAIAEPPALRRQLLQLDPQRAVIRPG